MPLLLLLLLLLFPPPPRQHHRPNPIYVPKTGAKDPTRGLTGGKWRLPLPRSRATALKMVVVGGGVKGGGRPKRRGRVNVERLCPQKRGSQAGSPGFPRGISSPLPPGIAHHFGGWLWILPTPRPRIASTATAETEEDDDGEPRENGKEHRRGTGLERTLPRQAKAL